MSDPEIGSISGDLWVTRPRSSSRNRSVRYRVGRKSGWLKPDPFHGDIVQATIGAHTPIVSQLYVLRTSVSHFSLFNMDLLIPFENIDPRTFRRPSFRPASPCI
jgi:hypothetical protein